VAPDSAIDSVDTEDPPGAALQTPKDVRDEIRRGVRQFERGPQASAAAPAEAGQSGPEHQPGETQGRKGTREQPGGPERRSGVAATPQQAQAPPVINPVFAALSIPTHQATPETRWEIAQAAAESWLSAMDPERRQSLWNQWRQSQMHSRLMAKVIETLAGDQQQSSEHQDSRQFSDDPSRGNR
jgi:hypothetical protein